MLIDTLASSCKNKRDWGLGIGDWVIKAKNYVRGIPWVLFTGDRGLGKNPVKFSRLLPNTQYTVQQRRSFRR
ncbi:MAG: hypothetical protein HXY43_00410 [Fischerella sp.]|uniref:hypothetical protein n=1 Tax=Fischerella sp. TaxID=1191 RepID=UPI001794EBED|nr:hypothetical protein [Fischerella sp.]NWF57816.1 hypothetical protein [Fischerella sp.]